jgi:predicted nucleotidyltransferase
MQHREGDVPVVAAIIEQKKDDIVALCREYGVQRLDLFGSAASDRFDPETSDADFVVAFAGEEHGTLYRYVDLAEALEQLLGRPIDLLTERAIGSPEFRSAVDASRLTIYERNRDQAVA